MMVNRWEKERSYSCKEFTNDSELSFRSLTVDRKIMSNYHRKNIYSIYVITDYSLELYVLGGYGICDLQVLHIMIMAECASVGRNKYIFNLLVHLFNLLLFIFIFLFLDVFFF